MGEDDDHGSSKSSLSSIWHRGKEKVGMGSGKGVKFMPNLTPGEGSATGNFDSSYCSDLFYG